MSTSEIDFSRTYLIGPAYKRGVLHFHRGHSGPNWDALVRGDLHPAEPLKFLRDSGTRSADLMGDTLGLTFVSQRVVDALYTAGITGWRTFPVVLQNRQGEELSGYRGFAVTGRAGPIDRSRRTSGPLQTATGETVMADWGLYFEPTTWDGSDVFCPEGTTAFCVRAHVKDVVEGIGATNARFTALTEFFWGLSKSGSR